jgi:uncharacterized membrane protein YpjA
MQFAATPVALWFFVSDCPNYTLFFALALLFLLMGKRYDLYYYLASVGTAKYGFWTLFAILFYRDYFLSSENRLLYTGLFISHFAMMLEPLAILHRVRVRGWYIPVCLAWFLLNDYFDYILGVHPWVPNHSIPTLMWATVGMSLGFTLLIYHLTRRTKRALIFDF